MEPLKQKGITMELKLTAKQCEMGAKIKSTCISFGSIDSIGSIGPTNGVKVRWRFESDTKGMWKPTSFLLCQRTSSVIWLQFQLFLSLSACFIDNLFSFNCETAIAALIVMCFSF